MMKNPHDSYHGMGDSYPYIAPCRLLLYCQDHGYPMNISYLDQPILDNSWYPVGLAWFDFSQDYFAPMSSHVIELLKQDRIKVLFYYHEGDNPFKQKQRLDELCNIHDLPTNCYRFVSGNTKANTINGFCYFPDHELFYWRNAVKWNNRSMPGCSYHDRPRTHRYTALNRLHKWWRSTVMAYLRSHDMLKNSFWSYNNIDMGDLFEDNPIEIDAIPGLRQAQQEFLKYAPHHCDELSEQEHNSHWTLIPEHYDESYVHLVLETLYDAEQSGGAFLSEKTFKPIRHAQPFVIFGTPNSLATLKELGYRTFDHVLDNSYDLEANNTQRFKTTMQLIQNLNQQDLHKFYVSCQDDILHNQQLFLSNKQTRLNNLLETLIT
jgi:hypothetical protein